MPVLIAVDPTILDRCSCRASVRDCHTTNPSNPPTYSTLPARLGVYLCLNMMMTSLSDYAPVVTPGLRYEVNVGAKEKISAE
jgi:hypothetical protein